MSVIKMIIIHCNKDQFIYKMKLKFSLFQIRSGLLLLWIVI